MGKGIRSVSIFIFLHVDVRLFPHHLFKRLPLLHRTASTLHKYSQGVFDYICVSVSGLSLLFYWSVCLFFHQYHTVFITNNIHRKSRLMGRQFLLLFSPQSILTNILSFIGWKKNIRIYTSLPRTPWELEHIMWEDALDSLIPFLLLSTCSGARRQSIISLLDSHKA